MTKFLEHRDGRREITKSIVVFYHANCTDGFSAAWAAWKKFGADAEYVATFHEDAPPVALRDKEIYTLDMTFTEPITRQLMTQNVRVTAIDHHESTQAVTLMTHQSLYAADHSGAVLAWNYFHPTASTPTMLLSVEDMDLWRLKVPGTKELYAYLDLFPFEFQTWSQLIDAFEQPAERSHMIETGATLLQHEEKMIERLISKDAHLVELAGYQVHAINASSAFRQYMGTALAAQSPSGVGLVWWETGDGYIAVSLRSAGVTDVAAIAAQYGGGGHPYSAGFRVKSFTDIPWKRVVSSSTS